MGRVLQGERRWDPVTVPSLEVFLIGVVRSLASHLVTGGSSRESGVEDAEQDLDCDFLHPRFAHPEALVGEAEQCEAIMSEALAAADGDLVIEKMLGAIMEGAVKADEIAEDTGLTAAQVYEGNRRLRRRLQTAARAKRRRP